MKGKGYEAALWKEFTDKCDSERAEYYRREREKIEERKMKRTNETIIITNFPDYGKAIVSPMKESRLGDSKFGLCLEGKWHNIDHNLGQFMKKDKPKLYAKLLELGVWRDEMNVYGIRYELDYEPHARALSHHCNLMEYNEARDKGKQNIILDYNDYKEVE